MSNLQKEIENYVESKRDVWSDRTLPVTRYILRSLVPHWNSPYRNFKELVRRGKKKYTIKTYFIVAGKFEEESLGTHKYKDFLRRNKAAFKNCYKDKVRLLKPEQFQKFLAKYVMTNVNMYNLLILMGLGGLRVSEALNVHWEDIQDGFLVVVGKGGKQRQVPFNVSNLIRKTLEQTGKVIGTLSFRFLFKRDLTPYTPHDFRAYYATCVANHPELSIKDAALLLGHSSITTTGRYVRSDLNRIKKVMENRDGN